MAHLENGYSKIANETLESLALNWINLSDREWRLLMVVFRLTYGFSRKWARISFRTYSRMTGIGLSHCHSTEKRLRDRNMLVRKGERVKFQKYSEKWKNVPSGENTSKRLEDLKAPKRGKKSKNVPPGGNVTEGGNKNVPPGGNTLNKKEILIKKASSEFVNGWEFLLEKIRRCGRYECPEFDDPVLAAVAKRIGWTNLCNMTNFTRKEIRSQAERYFVEEFLKREDVK